MKYSDLLSKNRSSYHWINFAAAGLLAVALAGCGGSSGGGGGTPPGGGGGTPAPGPTSSTGATAPLALSSNASTAAQWTALQPAIDPTSISVTINSPPVVKFKVTDANGIPVVGLGGQSQSATGVTHSNYNMSFTLAKLVPGTNGDPSKWVSYIVVRPPTVAEKTATPETKSCDAATNATWCGTYPAADTQGTLVDNGDGSYQYTFYRDIKQAATIAAGLIDSTDGLSKKADLGDLTYDPNATHRLGIFIAGSMPGTGTATATAVQTTTPVPLVNTFNIGYDFVPAGGPVTTTRDIVVKASCTACHDGKGIGHVSTASATNGIPAGAFVGRNNPRLCVTCHTDQTKYGFAAVTTTTNADGSPAYSGAYYRLPSGTVPSGMEAAFIYPRMIHQTHMGDELVKTGYNLNNHCNKTTGANLAQCYDLVGFPQDQRNCTKCHDGSATAVNPTANGDNWKNNPSILACGACHDGINFADGSGITLAERDADVAAKNPVGTTATGHIGGAQPDNSQCAICHNATTIPVYHQTNTATAFNPNTGAWLNRRTHTVSTISYDIKSVTVNSSNQPVITFKITKDGTAVTSFNVPTLVANVSKPSATSGGNGVGALQVAPAYEPITGFAGGPSFYVAFAVPQDNIPAPADFNAYLSASLANLLVASGSPNAGTITGPDSSGYFIATLTGDLTGQPVTASCLQNTGGTSTDSHITGNCVNPSPIVIPTGAKLVTGAMIGTFTQKNVADYPYTPAVVTTAGVTAGSAKGGVIIKSMLAKKEVSSTDARRVIVATAKCNSCHDQLGTSPEFHGGARNDPTACAICHNANRVNGGWAVDSRTFIHGIHARDKRTTPYTWNKGSTAIPKGWAMTLFPGVIKDCTQCHVDNAVNLGATGTTVVSNLLWPTVAAGATSAGATTSPYVTVGTNYGNAFIFTPAGATVGAYTPSNGTGAAGTAVPAHVAAAGGEIVPAQSTTLVNSPIASACYSCHDTSTAKGHMTSNGGAIYEARATALLKSEGCLTCHGQNKVEDVAVVHR